MLIGIVGKSNTGKTTFFSAATLVDAEISNRIFTTIKPNRGVSYARIDCVCKNLGVTCDAKNSKCIDNVRFIPIKMVDIAGLVPGAHEGKGLGNQFLSDIMEADALIHVVDISGSTDKEGNPIEPGSFDPLDDIRFLPKEICYWILGILKKNWDTICKRVKATKENLHEAIYNQFSGLKINPEDVKNIVKKTGLSAISSDEKIIEFITELLDKSKPIAIAANKIDIETAEKNIERAKSEGFDVIPCSAETELTLRRAEKKGLIKYKPGANYFDIISDDMDEKQKEALDFLRNRVIRKYGSTGVQKTINKTVFDVLNYIVVYPVSNINSLTDKSGNVLPDVHLVPKGTKLKDFAGMIHTDIKEKFIGGLKHDGDKTPRIGADYELQNNDIVEILTGK
ncbi:MAG: redox-regulated ATPase YchF [Nanoarchaeota archaeon]